MLSNTPVNYQTSSQAQSELIPEKEDMIID